MAIYVKLQLYYFPWAIHCVGQLGNFLQKMAFEVLRNELLLLWLFRLFFIFDLPNKNKLRWRTFCDILCDRFIKEKHSLTMARLLNTKAHISNKHFAMLISGGWWGRRSFRKWAQLRGYELSEMQFANVN